MNWKIPPIGTWGGISTLLEQEMDWHELEDPANWHMGWN